MNDETDELGVMTRIDGVLAALGSVDDLSVIDIGCGEGEVAGAFAAAGATVRGFDPFIAQGDWIEVGGGRYRLLRGRADAIPEPDASADIVLFMFSLHHVPQAEMPAALAEAQRLLKPGGRLCVAEPVAAGPAQHVMEPYHDETEVRSNALAALNAHAVRAFDCARTVLFSEARRYADFGAYAEQALKGMRFNGFTEDQVVNPSVAARFDAMVAEHGNVFEQPVRVNLFSDHVA